MIALYKYNLRQTGQGTFVASMPTDRKILSVQIQDGEFRAWALVDVEDRAHTDQIVYVLKTGINGDLDEFIPMRFLNRIDWNGMVFHAFVPA